MFFESINIAKKSVLESNFCYRRTIFKSNNSSTFPDNRSSEAATIICCGRKVLLKCVFRNFLWNQYQTLLEIPFREFTYSIYFNAFWKDASFILLDISKLFFKDFHHKCSNSFHWILVTILKVFLTF